MDELRVAYLKDWQRLGFDAPVYGVLDVEELTVDAHATLVTSERDWCIVILEDVVMLPSTELVDRILEDFWDEVTS